MCLQIIHKSPDGWWTGRMQDTEGDFPASFVEEIEIPTTVEEKKQLALRFRKGSPDKLQIIDGRYLLCVYACLSLYRGDLNSASRAASVAQLVEHTPRMDDVMGQAPPESTFVLR